MEEILDELLVGINDELTKQLEILFANSNLEREQKLKIVEIINEAYVEGGMHVLPKWRKKADEEMKQELKEFQNGLMKKLSDGQDNTENK